jgi:hypothetical protein
LENRERVYTFAVPKEGEKILRVCCGKKRFKKSLENRERVYTFAVPKREGEDFKGLLW